MGIHRELIVVAKVLAVALAVGLDVLAVSIGVGVAQVAREVSVKVWLAFASSEITMQVVGYELGAGAGRMLGEVGAYAGFALLALVGVLMIRSSLLDPRETQFEATRQASSSRGSQWKEQMGVGERWLKDVLSENAGHAFRSFKDLISSVRDLHWRICCSPSIWSSVASKTVMSSPTQSP